MENPGLNGILQIMNGGFVAVNGIFAQCAGGGFRSPFQGEEVLNKLQTHGGARKRAYPGLSYFTLTA